VYYVIVNESGASVYSASEIARDEFPDFNVEERSAVSIARRLQDPLAELIKINPESIGVVQYQHDLPQKQLDSEVEATVETAVKSEEHTSELQSRFDLVCRLLLEKKKKITATTKP